MNESNENSNTSMAMHRSISMPDKARAINPYALERSEECETLDEVPSESEMSLDHESFSKDISVKL